MARPAKPNGTAVGARKKDEIESRASFEKQLQGNTSPKPPRYLTKEQKKIFREIVKRMEEANVLCALDNWILAKTAVAIEKLQSVDLDIEKDPSKKYDKDVMNTRAKYTQDFYRGCNELGLSPQARAKMAISMTKQEDDPLWSVLTGDDDD